MAEKRITRKALKNHWHYSWWKYLLMAVLCIVCTDVLFTVTAYHPPETKKIELYILNGTCDALALQDDLKEVFFETCPDQEELTVQNIDLTGGDMYAAMQLSTYTAAQKGDVCLIAEQDMRRLSAEGAEYAFVNLTPYIERGLLDGAMLEDDRGILLTSYGESGVFVIPADDLGGLRQFGTDPSGSYLCVLDYCGNEENAVNLMNLMIQRYRTDEVQEEPISAPIF